MDIPKNLKMKRTHLALIMFVALAFVPILFQNCAAPIEEEGDLSGKALGAPFAFEHKLNHFAYMSCSGMPAGYDPNTYFTFKTGAYGGDSGIKLNSTFVSYVRNDLVSSKANILALSEANKNAYLTMAVRPASNLQSGFTSNPFDPSTFIEILTEPGIANMLAENNGSSYLQNFLSAPVNKWLDATAHFTANETIAQQIRTTLNGGGYITTNYNKGTDAAINALSPDDSNTKIYGLGYKANINTVGFGLTSAYTSGALRIMTNLQEYNLESGMPTASIWDCKEEWRFMIIRPTDGNVDALCPGFRNATAPAAPSAKYDMFLVLKQLMPKWGVNLDKKCIVPLASNTGQCYGTSTNPINYQGGTCDPVLGTCPHYVSICKKR